MGPRAKGNFSVSGKLPEIADPGLRVIKGGLDTKYGGPQLAVSGVDAAAAVPRTQPRIVGPQVYCVDLSREAFGRSNPAVSKLFRYEF
jgi:hypothetical protein